MYLSKYNDQKKSNILKTAAFVLLQASILFFGILVGCWVTVGSRMTALANGDAQITTIRDVGIAFTVLFFISAIACGVTYYLYKDSIDNSYIKRVINNAKQSMQAKKAAKLAPTAQTNVTINKTVATTTPTSTTTSTVAKSNLNTATLDVLSSSKPAVSVNKTTTTTTSKVEPTSSGIGRKILSKKTVTTTTQKSSSFAPISLNKATTTPVTAKSVTTVDAKPVETKKQSLFSSIKKTPIVFGKQKASAVTTSKVEPKKVEVKKAVTPTVSKPATTPAKPIVAVPTKKVTTTTTTTKVVPTPTKVVSPDRKSVV